MNPKSSPGLSSNSTPSDGGQKTTENQSQKQREQLLMYLLLADAKRKAELLDKMNSKF